MRTNFILPAMFLLIATGCASTDPIGTNISYTIDKDFLETTTDNGVHAKTWMTFLHLEGTADKIPLIPIDEIKFPDQSPYMLGLREDSIVIRPLGEDLYWVKWNDLCSHGSMGLMTTGYVIFEMRDGVIRELLRDHFVSYSRGAWYLVQGTDVEVSYDEPAEEITIIKNHHIWKAAGDKHPLCGETRTISGGFSDQDCFVSDIHIIKTYTYRLAGTYLVYGKGVCEIDFGTRRFPLNEVNEYCDNCHCFDEIPVSERIIRRLNGLAADAKECSGRVVITDDLGPIRPQTYEQASDLS